MNGTEIRLTATKMAGPQITSRANIRDIHHSPLQESVSVAILSGCTDRTAPSRVAENTLG